MILEVDIGNTRLKWRVRNANTVILDGAIYIDDALSSLRMISLKPSLISQVVVASVVDEKLEKKFAAWSKDEFAIEPQFVRTGARCGKVRNGYRNFSALGVDRWLAVLAAYKVVQNDCVLGQSGCVVVSCGTAVTVDLVKADGTHLGGYIAPGLTLMLGALTGNTRQIKLDRENLILEVRPGRTTTEAVHAAISIMIVGLVEKAIQELRQQDSAKPVALVMTGGDATKLLPFFPQVRHIPDLVLNGLDCVLADSN